MTKPIDAFNIITDEMMDLYAKKNKDYGSSFDKSLDEDGLLVSKIRLSDKLSRFANLIKNESLVKDESVRDTLIDLANYAVMTIIWLDSGNAKLYNAHTVTSGAIHSKISTSDQTS